MKALLFERNVPRFVASRIAATIAGSGRGVGVGPLALVEIDPPELPGPKWARVAPRLAGICGSDLSTLDGHSSRYFDPIVSFPFVPGHEVVGDVVGGAFDKRRVVVEPVLGCEARGIEPPCDGCAKGRKGSCERVAFGHLRPGLQTGYCKDTGGGWSASLVAHESQLHEVPDELSDEAAVMVEPAACALHAVLSAGKPGTDTPSGLGGASVVVLGAGTLGLCATAALRRLCTPATVLTVAKYAEQQVLAARLGADVVVAPDELGRAARRLSGSLAHEGKAGGVASLTGGVDVVFDCVGSGESISTALSVVRPGGEVVLVGMPGTVQVDLAPLWHREVNLHGAYAYGTETVGGAVRSSFDVAFELVADAGLERLVTARYGLEHYAEAVAHAASAGRRGAVKVVFDLRRPAGTGAGGRSFETKEDPS